MPSHINFSKVQSLAVVAANDGFVVQVVYKSGQKRGFTYGNDEPGLDTLFAEAISAGVTVTALNGQPQPSGQADEPESKPNALVAMLGLGPEQAKHLEGADRINFWRNGSLHLQANHGSRGIKLACPKAIVTDAQLVEFFAAWGWQQLGPKPYFKSTPASLVRL